MARIFANQNLIAITFVVLSTLFFAIQDVLTKAITHDLPAWQIVCVRFFFFSLFALAFAWHSTGIRKALRSGNPWLQIFRGVLIVSEIALFAFTIGYLGLAEMHALFACFPLIVTALSPLMLGETVGWRRWFAVVAGFAGTLIILRPGSSVFDPHALLVIVCATALSIYIILTRRVSRYDSLETSLLYFGLTGFGCSLLIAPIVWIDPDPQQWGLLLLLSASAIVGHFSLIKALQLAPAVLLQPFNYFVLVFAIIFGYIIFDEVLNGITISGAIIVVASGLFVARREYIRSGRLPAQP